MMELTLSSLSSKGAKYQAEKCQSQLQSAPECKQKFANDPIDRGVDF